jgi:hypothetical protein
MFDFAEFDTETEMFNLKIAAPQEHKLAATIPIADVTGPIDKFGIVRIQRILNERFGGALRIVEVAQRKR